MKNTTRKTLLLVLALTALLAVVALGACKGGGNEAKLSVTFDDSHVIYEGDSLDSLRPHISVKYTDKDGATIDVTDFELSGTLKQGGCAVTVSYNGLSKSFAVTVKKQSDKPNPPQQYTVTFKADGKVVGTATYTAENKNISEPAVPAKTGYTGAWEAYALTTGDVTVNAVYTAKQYTVTLDYDGATAGNGTKTITVTYDQPIGALPAPTKMGYAFAGWKLNNEIVTAETVWQTDGDATLIAQWTSNDTPTPPQQYTVTFKADGKTVGTATYTGENKNITEPAVPAKTGYTGAWEEYTLDGNVTVNAIYTAKQYTVALNYDGATGGNTQQTLTVTFDQAIGALPTPTKTGYVFVGWKLGNTVVTAVSVWTTDNSVTLIAQWRAIDDPNPNIGYTVTFKADGKTVGTATYTAENKNISEPAVPEKTGYAGAWESYTLTTGDVTVNAIYTAKQYTVALNYDGATAGNGTKTITVTFDQAIGALPAPTKDGAEFAGWKLNNETVTAETVWQTDGNATFTAQWTTPIGELEYTLNSDGNSYSVTGIGTATDSNIVIPSTYNNLPVTSIGSSAFFNCRSLTSIMIPSSVTSIGSAAFHSCRNLASVIFADNCQPTSIGNSAFYNCSNLTSITIPSSVTSIGDNAFYNCSSIASVIFADNSQLTSIGYDAFCGCRSLTSITIPESVTSIGNGALSGCSGLESITVAEGNVKYHSDGNFLIETATKTLIGSCKNSVIPTDGSVTGIGSYAFSYCSSLTSITIPESVTSIGNYAFSYCSSLTIYCEAASQPSGWSRDWNYSSCPVVWNCNENNLDEDGYAYAVIGGVRYSLKDGTATVVRQPTNIVEAAIAEQVTFDGSQYSVTSIVEYAFSGCSSLTSITIPESVTSIGGSAFSGCSSLESITLPFVGASRDGAEKTHFGYIFGASVAYDSNRNTLQNSNSVPSSLKTVVITGGSSIDSYAFRDCSRLTSITIASSVTSVGSGAFYNCSSLASVTFAANSQLESIGYNALCGCSSLTSITMPSSVTSIGQSAFHSCLGLASVTFAENSQLTSIGSSAFRDCSNLTSITISSGVTSIGDDAFRGCGRLAGVTFAENSQFTSIGERTFDDCRSLTSITIPSSVTSIGSDAFSYCSSLTIYCEASSKPSGWSSSWNYSSRNSICPVVWNCNENKVATDGYMYAVIDGARYSLKDGIATVVRQPTNIVEAAIVEQVTFDGAQYSVTSIVDYAFSGCGSLTSITIPSSVTSIGDGAFSGCSSLASVTFAENSQLTSIGSDVFYNCSSLASITIPSSVTSIGNYAFSGCSNLTEITIPSNVTSIGNYAYQDCSRLTSVTYAVNSLLTSIGERTFSGCSSLTKIVTPSSVTSIGKDAFSYCSRLTSITIPSSVTSIGFFAFFDCSSLTIYCEAASKPSGWNSDWNPSNRPVVWGYTG